MVASARWKHGNTEGCAVLRRALRFGLSKLFSCAKTLSAGASWSTQRSERVVGTGCHLQSIPNSSASPAGVLHYLPTEPDGMSCSRFATLVPNVAARPDECER